MNRIIKRYTNYLLYIFLFLSILVTSATSYIIWFVLPRGVGMHGEQYCQQHGTGRIGNPYGFFGLFRYTWIEIHNWAAVVLFAAVLIHIILHWSWIVETTKRVVSHLIQSARKIIEIYIAALIVFILFLFECFSGLILWQVIPRGREDYYRMTSGLGRRFWGLQRNIWVDLHAWVAVAIIGIIIIHIVLNWSWIVGMTRNAFRRILPNHSEKSM